jgi:hypothetical protein
MSSYLYRYPYYDNYYPMASSTAFSSAVVPYGYPQIFDQLPSPPEYDVRDGSAWSRWWTAFMTLANSAGMVTPFNGDDWTMVNWITPNYGVHQFYWIPPSVTPYIQQAWAVQRAPAGQQV